MVEGAWHHCGRGMSDVNHGGAVGDRVVAVHVCYKSNLHYVQALLDQDRRL